MGTSFRNESYFILKARSPQIGGGRQNAAPLSCTISADIQSLPVILPQTVTQRLYAGRTRNTHFCAVFIALCSRPETASDVIFSRYVGPVVREKQVQFCDPRLNRSREISPEAVGGGEFATVFSNVDNFRPKVAIDVISVTVIDPTLVDFRVKCRDCRSNRARDIRLPQFVTDGRTTNDTDVCRSSHKAKTPY